MKEMNSFRGSLQTNGSFKVSAMTKWINERNERNVRNERNERNEFIRKSNIMRGNERILYHLRGGYPRWQ